MCSFGALRPVNHHSNGFVKTRSQIAKNKALMYPLANQDLSFVEVNMDWPDLESKNKRLWKEKTALGYLQFRCRVCDKQFNKRTGTFFNYIQYPTEVVILAVHYYYRFRNSLD